MDNGQDTARLEQRAWGFAIVPLWLYEAIVPERLEGNPRPARRLSSEAIALYGLMAGKYANHKSGRAFPTHAQLAADLGASDRSVRRWLAELELVGALTRDAGRPGRATVYWLEISRSVRKSGDNSAGTPDTSAGASDTGVRAARTPVSDELEDLSNEKGFRAAREVVQGDQAARADAIPMPDSVRAAFRPNGEEAVT